MNSCQLQEKLHSGFKISAAFKLLQKIFEVSKMKLLILCNSLNIPGSPSIPDYPQKCLLNFSKILFSVNILGIQVINQARNTLKLYVELQGLPLLLDGINRKFVSSLTAGSSTCKTQGDHLWLKQISSKPRRPINTNIPNRKLIALEWPSECTVHTVIRLAGLLHFWNESGFCNKFDVT